jgi:D-xylose transport system permease protein
MNVVDLTDSTPEPRMDGDSPVAGTDFVLDQSTIGLGETIQNYFGRFKRGGDLGLAPALAALAILTAVFGILRHESFLTLFNFGNFFTQAAPYCVLAIAVTFVLLLGEIDLGAGYTAGVCAAIMAWRLKAGWPLPFALLLAFAAAVLMGAFVGAMVAKLGIPSFVVTLSTFLAWQGILLQITKDGGTIRIENSVIVAIENKNMASWLGWLMWALLVGGYFAVRTTRARARHRAGLGGEAMSVIAAKTIVLALVWGIGTLLLNRPRGAGRVHGVPWVVPLVLVLVVVLTFLLERTAWGRHLLAVGGNAEAARRAGISLVKIRMQAFILTAVLACVAGIILASRLNSVDPQTGGNDTLLIAVGAAVIGGTSLFGGRGRVINGLVGGLVFGLINNGLPLLKTIGGIDFSAAGPKFIVNGAVLLLFASLDAISRRGSPSR